MSKHPIFKLSAGVVMGVTGGIMLISSIVLVVQNAEAITSQFGERIGAHELAAPPNVSPRMCADHLNMSGFSASVTASR